MTNLAKARANFLEKESILSKYATKSSDAIRIEKEDSDDIRTPYFRDIDRIIHSLSYTRYIDKTQVYSFKDNDHISKRMVHVQLVSKIARTIGRALKLNEDLIEAIALGHDIGHTPLGHAGESMLNEITKEELNEYFAHNIQGVRNLMVVDHQGYGQNLTIQTLDGVLCHNGEMLSEKYVPMKKDLKEFLREYKEGYQDFEKLKKCSSMTLEGCVVRISDIVGYIGRDIEDAIELGLFQREELPEDICHILGNNNRDIVNTIILDIIKESMDKPYIKMSKEVFEAVFRLKKFNDKNIYSKSMNKKDYTYYQKGMRVIYKIYLEAITKNDRKNIIYEIFLNHQSQEYLQETNDKRKVIDFISGMTDELFLHQIEKYYVVK
ncbi:MAG: HD domain-containing protein [Bacilli bacterium]|nr:HD domain-containing protein [Bacilli bacterium]